MLFSVLLDGISSVNRLKQCQHCNRKLFLWFHGNVMLHLICLINLKRERKKDAGEETVVYTVATII